MHTHEIPQIPAKTMPEARFRKEKEEIVLTTFAYTAYSGSVRNITYIVGRSYPAFAIKRIVETSLLTALGAIVIAAACQGCAPPPVKPSPSPWKNTDAPVYARAASDGRGCLPMPNGKKALNSESGQGELRCN